MENEFPKCLYLGNELYGEYKVVFNEDEEKEANAAGFGVDAEPKSGKKAK